MRSPPSPTPTRKSTSGWWWRAAPAWHWPGRFGLAITGLLVIVALSYFQTIQAYPSGGGSYVVARENLGSAPGWWPQPALLIDYLLTAAVSFTAGVEALASAFPRCGPTVAITLTLVIAFLITLANLRGLRETGTLMSIPVYLFLFLIYRCSCMEGSRSARRGELPRGYRTSTLPSPVTTFFYFTPSAGLHRPHRDRSHHQWCSRLSRVPESATPRVP